MKTDLNWLEKLKKNSWEPEILISGIAIYALIQVPKFLDQFLRYFLVNINGQIEDIHYAVALFKIASYWVILMLTLHLVVRSVWIGILGLSYVFPNMIKHDNLKVTGKFKNELKQIPDYESLIIQLENLSSSLFSIAFLLLMSILGSYNILIIMGLLPVILSDAFFPGMERFNLALMIYLYSLMSILFIAAIDFVTLGYFRRFKIFSKIYYPAYKIINILSFANLYRPIYYSFITNYKKWKIVLFLTIFACFTIYWWFSLSLRSELGFTQKVDQFSKINLYNHPGIDRFYDDQNAGNYSLNAHIQSDIIKENTIRLFVVARADIEDDIRNYVNYDSLSLLQKSKANIDLHCISKFYYIYLGDSLVKDLTWWHYFKSHTKQKGYLTYIDISELPKGNYRLKIKGPPSYQSITNIPFYREEEN